LEKKTQNGTSRIERKGGVKKGKPEEDRQVMKPGLGRDGRSLVVRPPGQR